MSHTWNVHLYIAALTRRFATNTQHDRLWSAAPATQNEATRHLKPPKVTTFVNSPEARPYYPRDDCSQTVANGCRHLRTQKQRRANTSQPPDPQSKTRTFRYAFGEKKTASGLSYLLAKTYGCLLPAVPHPKAGQLLLCNTTACPEVGKATKHAGATNWWMISLFV